MNIKKLPDSVIRVPLKGNVLFLSPTTGEITEEEIPPEKGYNINFTPVTLTSIPTWCKTCHPQPGVEWSNSGGTAYSCIGEGLEHVNHFDKQKRGYVLDGYYCHQCDKLYV